MIITSTSQLIVPHASYHTILNSSFIWFIAEPAGYFSCTYNDDERVLFSCCWLHHCITCNPSTRHVWTWTGSKGQYSPINMSLRDGSRIWSGSYMYAERFGFTCSVFGFSLHLVLMRIQYYPLRWRDIRCCSFDFCSNVCTCTSRPPHWPTIIWWYCSNGPNEWSRHVFVLKNK